MRLPVLSIIVPVYNMEDYVEECLKSILSQSFDSYELIIVDDGSTDSSAKICDWYGEKYEIKVIHKKNGGLISARKAGIAVAEGKYIGFVDSDDWIDSDMYKCLVANAEQYDADVVSCGYYVDGNDSRSVVLATKDKRVISFAEDQTAFLDGLLTKGFDWVKGRNITPSVCNKIFRKTVLTKVYREIDERILWEEDTVTVLSAVFESQRIALIPDILYHYRKNSTSMSHKLNKGVIQNYVYVFDELERISRRNGGILDNQISLFSVSAFRTALEVGFGVESGKQYLFPFGQIQYGSKVIIYGAGQVGRCYYREVTRLDYFKELYFTDSDSRNWSGEIISPNEAFEKEYDVVVIAIENKFVAQKVRMSLIEKGVPESKLYWQEPIVIEDVYSFRTRNITR